MKSESVRIGTCSWNDKSWLGLIYSKPSKNSAGFLPEYAQHFRTAEVDSWFYRLPERKDVLEYLGAVDEDFRFTVKVTEDISLTHKRNRESKDLISNPAFLSQELFAAYLDRIGPMLGRIDAVMLEFEYLNRDKMGSPEEFMRAIELFADKVPRKIPLAVETRNKNYLTKEYFQFLKTKGIIHVFSEKIYMPHVYEVYEEFADLISGTSVIRLLGGDRKEMEDKAQGRWNKITDEKPDKERVVEMTKNIVFRGGKAIISINNHYEGSAPLTADFFFARLGV